MSCSGALMRASHDGQRTVIEGIIASSPWTWRSAMPRSDTAPRGREESARRESILSCALNVVIYITRTMKLPSEFALSFGSGKAPRLRHAVPNMYSTIRPPYFDSIQRNNCEHCKDRYSGKTQDVSPVDGFEFISSVFLYLFIPPGRYEQTHH